jgi:hypothetical protein
MKKGEAIVTSWKDILEELPIEPEGYSTAQQISEKVHIAPQNIVRHLDKAGVKFIWGRSRTGQKTRYYKD